LLVVDGVTSAALGRAVLNCKKCGEHDATVTWVGESVGLARAHGWGQPWCLCCSLEAQLEHAKEMVAKIPELEAALKKACVTPRVERSE
jgi:hypothetical protein